MNNSRYSINKLTNRRFDYLIRRERWKKDRNKWLSLADSLTMQASFPDSGYYYSLQSRERDRIGLKIIDKLPKKTKILYLYKAKQIERRNASYYESTIQLQDGSWVSPYELDAMMVYH